MNATRMTVTISQHTVVKMQVTCGEKKNNKPKPPKKPQQTKPEQKKNQTQFQSSSEGIYPIEIGEMPFTSLYDFLFYKDIQMGTNRAKGNKADQRCLSVACSIQQVKAVKRHITRKCHKNQKIQTDNPDQEVYNSVY